MAEETFAVGDVVQLKSGGPKMTAGEVSGSDVWCQWFDGEGKPQGNNFKAAMLKKPAQGGPVAFAM